MPPRRFRRAVRRPRRAVRRYANAMLRRRVFNPQPVFTETFAQTPISSGAGGVFYTNMGVIPQFSSYSKLYRTFRILKMTVIVIPDATVNTDYLANATASASSFRGTGRLVYAINDSANFTAPTSENDVLVDNGCKVRMLTKPIKISCKPQPQISVSGGAYVNTTKTNWLDMDTAAAINHNGIAFWYTTTGGQTNTAQIYFKVTFALKDPR